MNQDQLIITIRELCEKEELSSKETMELLVTMASGISCSCSNPFAAIGLLLGQISSVYTYYEDLRHEKTQG